MSHYQIWWERLNWNYETRWNVLLEFELPVQSFTKKFNRISKLSKTKTDCPFYLESSPSAYLG